MAPGDGKKTVEAAGRAAGLAERDLRDLDLGGGDAALVRSLAIKMARDVRRDRHRRSVRRLGLHLTGWVVAVSAVVGWGGAPTWLLAALGAWALAVALHALAVRGNAPPREQH